MIEIIRISGNSFEAADKLSKGCWVNAVSPTDEEIARLKSIVDIPNEIFSSLKDLDEVSTLIDYDKFHFIILRLPFDNPDNDFEYYSLPIGIIIAKGCVITLCYHPNEVVQRLKSKKFPMTQQELVLNLFLVNARLYLTYLNHINKKVYRIESQLEKSQKNTVIIELREIEKSLVYFSTALKSNHILLERIAEERLMFGRNGQTKLLHKAIDENKQAIELTTIYSDILSNTLDAFASIISNNLNTVMKLLASLTIILMLPTLVASVYGMNVALPFQQNPHAFAIVMGISFAVASAAVAIMWKSNYF